MAKVYCFITLLTAKGIDSFITDLIRNDVQVVSIGNSLYTENDEAISVVLSLKLILNDNHSWLKIKEENIHLGGKFKTR